ncbi:Aminopeptidase N [Lacunisphaera limnophila]|uniref:Aminopeptidase n=1 Tax=Lacunisphaera limnophila TaxID=1838286 RepID=A0A1D8AS17_9BACT|nr:M1 family metallopeptidase [Lacunisphaera limnophila]AOS43659.1 Aminopeptidase N [Lacunisphaera limnophila]
MPKSLRRLATLLSLFVAGGALAASQPVDPLRLTREVEPVAQSVELTLDPAKDDFSGRVIIDLLANQPFTSFRLNAEGPTFSTATLTSADGEVTTLQAEVTNAKFAIVTLTAPKSLGIGNYKLVIDFTAKYPRDGLGLYKTVSRDEPYLFTQFEDKHARKAFPCWDEPEFKINWQLTLKIPATLEAVTNAAVAYESRDGDWKTIVFGRTPPMPSYIVALAVGPFEYVPVPGWTVPGRIITPKGQSALAAEAVRLTPRIMARLEEYFGIPYPYAKYDQIAVPEYVYGAMENAGLVTFTDRLLLMDPEKPSFSQRRSLASVIAHEGAHMWFGDLVTMKWWDDLWLNESFADWMAGRIIGHEFPEFRIQVAESRGIKGAMRSDALPSITAIRRPVTAESDLAQLVDELTYNKGKGVLNMVENWIGPAQFRAAMRTYFLKHRWGNTVSDDLWAAFSATSGDDITGLLAAFINKPGVPLVTLALDPDGKLRLSQRRFHNLGDPQLEGQWQIPVVLAWGKGGEVHRERILLKDLEQVVAIPGLADADWIYPNAGESGYFRWNLSPELNARLARRSAALAPIERVGLLDNTSALFNAGLINGTDYLAYVTAFGGDLDPDVNTSVIASVGGLRNTFITPPSRPAYNSYRTAILRPILDRIGLQPVAGEPVYHGPLRNALYGALGYEAADPVVIAECRRLAALFLENPRQVDAALRTTALSVAAYHGDAAFFATIQAAFEKAPSPIVRSATLDALGSFHDPVLAGQALAFSLTPAVNSTEFLGVLFDISGDPDLRELAVDWTIAHYDAIAAKAPAEYVAGLIGVAGGAEPELFNRLRDFLLAPERKTEFAQINITKSAERLAVRQRLREKEQANVVKFLETYQGKTPRD